MTPDQRRRLVHNAGRGTALLMVASIAVLVGDYVRARVQLPKDVAAIAALQEKTQSDRTFARTLAAEQDRVTRTRQGRKRRDDAVAIVLIGAVGLFIASAKLTAADRERRPVGLPIQAIRMELLTGGLSPRASGLPAPAVAPGVDLSFVDALISKEGRSAEAAIPILQAIQEHYRYLPDEALRRVCELHRRHAGADRRHLDLLRALPPLAGRRPRRPGLPRHRVPRLRRAPDHRRAPAAAANPRWQ